MAGGQAANRSEDGRTGIKARVRSSEVRVVEQVEELRTELNADPFGDLEVPNADEPQPKGGAWPLADEAHQSSNRSLTVAALSVG